MQRETGLGEQTSAPMRPGSGSQRLPSSHLALGSPRAKEGLGCLWLRGPCCLAGGLRTLKPTPNVFSFTERADLASRSPGCTGPSNPAIASSGEPHLGPSSETAQNALLGAAFCKGKLCSGNKPQPQCGLAQDPSACLVLT